MSVDFSALNKITAKSFNEQKALIKKVLLGKPVKCANCQQILQLKAKDGNEFEICCPKGCTSIVVEAEKAAK